MRPPGPHAHACRGARTSSLSYSASILRERFLQGRRKASGKEAWLWRVAEDDPDFNLYAESSDADTVIGYIKAHT